MSIIETDRAVLEELQAAAREHKKGEILLKELHEGFRKVLEKKGEKIRFWGILVDPLVRLMGGSPCRLTCRGKVGKELPMPFMVQSTGMNLSKENIIVNIGQVRGEDRVQLALEPNDSAHYLHPNKHGFYDFGNIVRPTIDELKPYEAMLGFIREELGIDNQ